MLTTPSFTERMIETAHKYSRHAYMYVEYPHKSFWSEDFSVADLQGGLAPLANDSKPLMLYVHFPYCERQCFYCTCHTEINQDYERSRAYLELLFQEMALYQQVFDRAGIDPQFVEVHLGGGSPTLLQEKEFDALVDRLDRLVDVSRLREFAIEVDPRHTTPEKLRYYHSKGINRISLGIQSFDPVVQKAINRIQPRKLVEPLMTQEMRELFGNGINFDILCGLPNQTPERIRHTFEDVVDLAPDRICLNHLHFAPQFSPHQRFMVDGRNGRPTRLPDYIEKRILFREALNLLLQHGYVRTGFDHFARCEDDVAQALENGQMHWNSLGVTAGAYDQVLGVGPHSTSTLTDRYAQNIYGTRDYEKCIQQGQLPVFRGHVLSADDQIRRFVIQTLRNFGQIQFRDFETAFGIGFENYFSPEMDSLCGLVEDGLIEVDAEGLLVTELGWEFVLFICEHFDAYSQRA